MLKERQIDAFFREYVRVTTPPKNRREVLEEEAAVAAEKLHMDIPLGLTAQELQPYVEGKNIQRHQIKEITTLLSRFDHLYGMFKDTNEELANQYAAWIQVLLPVVFAVFEVHEIKLGKFGTVYNRAFEGHNIPKSEYSVMDFTP